MKRNKEVQKVNPGALTFSLYFSLQFVMDHCLSFCPFVGGLVLHALFQFTASDCRFDNYNFFLSIYRKIENSLKEVFFFGNCLF
jgi:hypothetical protein